MRFVILSLSLSLFICSHAGSIRSSIYSYPEPVSSFLHVCLVSLTSYLNFSLLYFFQFTPFSITRVIKPGWLNRCPTKWVAFLLNFSIISSCLQTIHLLRIPFYHSPATPEIKSFCFRLSASLLLGFVFLTRGSKRLIPQISNPILNNNTIFFLSKTILSFHYSTIGVALFGPPSRHCFTCRRIH